MVNRVSPPRQPIGGLVTGRSSAVASAQLKELVLYLDWSIPVHLVVVVDDLHAEERLVTVYEPATDRWSDDFRTRR